jgi:shikimate dehydrogenase
MSRESGVGGREGNDDPLSTIYSKLPTPDSRLRVGLIGDPVAHSRSPAMQNAAFTALGIAAHYELWPTPLSELAARVTSLRDAEILGANVTVPHKGAVMPLLDAVSPLAARTGAVNTIVVREGKLVGENTDVAGFARALREAGGSTRPLPRRVVVLGAGGAARAVLLALGEEGVPHVTVVNRTLATAQDLVAALAADARWLVEARPWEELPAALDGADCLVNATSLGWKPGEIPLDPVLLDLLTPDALVADLTYRQTDLLEAAAARSLRGLDGLPMLLHQGTAAFTLWTGREAPVDVMLRALMEGR